MAGRDDLAGMHDISTIRMIQTDVARHELGAAHERWSGAVRERDEIAEACSKAVQNWVDMLRSSAPDPLLMTISGQWLIEREAELKTANLREGILERDRNRAASLLALRRAELETTIQIGKRLRKTIEKEQEERTAGKLADAYLRRYAK
jgi:hypothetical protein